jgi:hypothetical protein
MASSGRGMRVTRPFDASTLLSIDLELCRRVNFAQGRESFDFAQDREPVERPAERPFGFTQGHESFDFAQDRELVERLVEWQRGVFRPRLQNP